jgi:hypothetical protein
MSRPTKSNKRHRRTLNRFPDQSYTLSEFAELERISRAFLYLLWERGEGPRYFYAGHCRRISHQARLDWQRDREAAAAQT